MEQDHIDYLHKKRSFFDILDRLNDDDELPELPDPGRRASEDAWKKSLKVSSTPRSLSRSNTDGKLMELRKNVVPLTNHLIQRSNTDLNIKEINRLRVGSSEGLQRTMPRAIQSSEPDASSRSSSKRKRDGCDRISLRQQGLFAGLHFYFFPNNDIHPARRMRIAKAVEFGASWEKVWNTTVTHIIMDKALDNTLLTRYLGFDAIPENVIIVPDNYTADCITYRMLLDPTQPCYAVAGVLQTSVAKADPFPLAKSLEVEVASKTAGTRIEPLRRAQRDEELVTATPSSLAPQKQAEEPSREPFRIVDSFPSNQMEHSKELDEALKQAKALNFMPLDEEDDGSRPSSSAGPSSYKEAQNNRLDQIEMIQNSAQKIQDKFQCMRKHAADKPDHPNMQTTNILQLMADYYGQVGDEWRLRAYRRAIATLRNHPNKVSTREEALSLPNIGARLAIKIEEIALTNRLQRLENARAEPDDQILQTFMGVYGAGIVQASHWVRQGYRSLDELLEKATLTKNQRIGIEHYEDFNSRIPRIEVERHGSMVRDALHKIDPAFEVIIGGSYRRGAASSGDIDCIVTRPDTNANHLCKVVLGELVPQLMAQGFLVASLATASRDDGSKWHGASCLPGGANRWRRLDLLLVPPNELGAALIYFTGNDIFNRSLRLLASKKGYRLNQRGLYYRGALRGAGPAQAGDGTLMESKDEKRIFQILGVPWRPPEHRIC